MAQGTIMGPFRFRTADFTLDAATIPAGNYKEWSNVDVSLSGWSPICLTRVTTNRSGVVINGFSLSRSLNTVYLMAKNVTNESINVNSAAITVLYIQ